MIVTVWFSDNVDFLRIIQSCYQNTCSGLSFNWCVYKAFRTEITLIIATLWKKGKIAIFFTISIYVIRINLIYNPGRQKFGLFIWTLHYFALFCIIFDWNDSHNSPIPQEEWEPLLWIFLHVMRILFNYNPGRCLGFWFEYSVFEAFLRDATFKKPF